MEKRKIMVSVMICICLLFTACGNGTEEAAERTDGGRSEREVTGAAVSGTTDTTIRPEELSDKLTAIGGEVDVTFFIKERTEQGYRARVKVKACEEEWESVYPEWELCLELKDEITEITGAEIKSREGNFYTIQGRLKETIFGDLGENEEAYTIWFDVKVACPNGAHDLGSCYWKSKYEDIALPEEDYKIETLEEKIQGKKVRVKLRLTNCSGKKMDRWLLWIVTNFDIKSISGAEICYQYEWAEGDYCVCGEKGNRSLGKGESVEITFSGECEKKTVWWMTEDVEVAKDMKRD